jgi:hypothetical protein
MSPVIGDSTLPAGPALDEAISAFEALVALSEEVEDEWLFINDLSTAYGEQLADLRARFGSAELPATSVAALEEAAAEVRLIRDPHKAIDWLSTFPAIVALALEAC